MVTARSKAERRAHDAAASVVDPELPFLTVADLGMLREVCIEDDVAVARIAPTYSGCPAQAVIEISVLEALRGAGFEARIERQLEPAWSTAWITPAGRAKLKAHGIAPPEQSAGTACELFNSAAPDCPNCGASETERLSEFGSTACKALYRCLSCREPFDYFKRI